MGLSKVIYFPISLSVAFSFILNKKATTAHLFNYIFLSGKHPLN